MPTKRYRAIRKRDRKGADVWGVAAFEPRPRKPEMLAKCRSKIEQAGVGGVVSYTQGDAEALPFPAASFDVAFLVAVLGEIPKPQRCLASLRRILRPGGLLSITEHLPDPDFSRFSTIRRLVERK